MNSTTEIIVVPKAEFDQLKETVSDISVQFAELLYQLKKADTLKNETWLTTTEACIKYKVSESTLHKRKKAGRITCWQDQKLVRWPESELQKNFTRKIQSHE